MDICDISSTPKLMLKNADPVQGAPNMCSLA